MKAQKEPKERDRLPSIFTLDEGKSFRARSRLNSNKVESPRKLKAELEKVRRENDQLKSSGQEIDKELNSLIKENKYLGPLAFIGLATLIIGSICLCFYLYELYLKYYVLVESI
ncbi:9190_t:CDS:2 [Diversispora eburnea]|uniref:9190_t:CDS:1 n=1 Tax=Diversispora eburnea TaxID=1213867 RepID=A0A9N8V5M1_9GLOM|nr:9190_t:CDS:2 [Diversispora eburnea]